MKNMRMPFFIGVMRYEKECAGRRGSSTCWWKKYQQPVIYVPVLTTRYMLHRKMYRCINHLMEFHQETKEYSDGKYLHSAHRIDMTWPLDILKSSKVYPCHCIVNTNPSLNYTITHTEKTKLQSTKINCVNCEIFAKVNQGGSTVSGSFFHLSSSIICFPGFDMKSTRPSFKGFVEVNVSSSSG